MDTKELRRLMDDLMSAAHDDGDAGLGEMSATAANARKALLDALEAAVVENQRLREIAAAMLPVMEAMRPLVLNLERLKDAAIDAAMKESAK